MRERRELRLYFRALADVHRLRMVSAMAHGDQISVKDLCLQMRVSQPLVSWHLRVLKRCGLVTTRRQGRQVFCSLDRAAFLAYQERVTRLIEGTVPEGDAGFRDDASRLVPQTPSISAGL